MVLVAYMFSLSTNLLVKPATLITVSVQIQLLVWGSFSFKYYVTFANNDQHFYHFSRSTNYEKCITCRRIRDELAKQNAETTDLTSTLDRVRTIWKQNEEKLRTLFLCCSHNNTRYFTGNPHIEGPTRGSKIRSHKILHWYSCLNIRCRPCCSSHSDVEHKQLNSFFDWSHGVTWGKRNPNTHIVF